MNGSFCANSRLLLYNFFLGNATTRSHLIEEGLVRSLLLIDHVNNACLVMSDRLSHNQELKLNEFFYLERSEAIKLFSIVVQLSTVLLLERHINQYYFSWISFCSVCLKIIFLWISNLNHRRCLKLSGVKR